jgi:ribose 5-phosphate isomerase B
MKIVVASDHAGVELRQEMADEATALGHEVTDLGPAPGVAIDYPVNGALVGRLVAAGEYDLGMLVCGTGVGISIAANKVPGIRAVVCSEPFTARLSRQHNNSNVLAVGARVVGPGLARMIVHEWLTAEFEGGRHARRVALIEDPETATPQESLS